MGLARRAAVAPALAVLLAACGGRGGRAPEPTASGSLGTVTASDARVLVAALCELEGPAATDPDRAGRIFYDRAHEALHVLAAAVEPVDRAAAAALLVAKERVEADLAGPGLSDAFPDHAAHLLEATRAALGAVGLPAPSCDDGTLG